MKNIHKLCSRLDETFYQDLELEDTSKIKPSPARIRELALQKLHSQQNRPVPADAWPEQEKRGTMKKTSIRLLIAAAILCALGITAVAALGGLNYFTAIFGDSAKQVEYEIETPELSVESGGYRLAAHALLSDGYKTELILALESLDGKTSVPDASAGFTAELEGGGIECSGQELPEFSSRMERFYRLTISTLKNIGDAPIEVMLDERIAPLRLRVEPGSRTPMKQVAIDVSVFEGNNYRPELIQLSPLGVLIIGSEQEAKGGLPIAGIYAVMRDGTQEEIMPDWAFDQSGEDEAPVRGGGAAVLSGPGEAQPLVVQTRGERNPDGKVVTTAYFSRILNLSDVRSILVDGKEFPLPA